MLRGGWHADFPHHTPAELYGVAVDVESYPRFLPWCLKARIREREAGRLVVDNLFGLGVLAARFVSHAVEEAPHRLTITSSDGPFRRFQLVWSFAPLAGTEGCRVEARYEMALRSPMLQAAAAMTMPAMEQKVVQGFKQRVRQVLGRGSAAQQG